MKTKVRNKTIIGPILRLQVLISEGCEKECIVYEGQTAEEIAESFSTQYDLSNEAKEKIHNYLSNELIKLSN